MQNVCNTGTHQTLDRNHFTTTASNAHHKVLHSFGPGHHSRWSFGEHTVLDDLRQPGIRIFAKSISTSLPSLDLSKSLTKTSFHSLTLSCIISSLAAIHERSATTRARLKERGAGSTECEAAPSLHPTGKLGKVNKGPTSGKTEGGPNTGQNNDEFSHGYVSGVTH
eukprot:11321-Amphidinium_carterae.1